MNEQLHLDGWPRIPAPHPAEHRSKSDEGRRLLLPGALLVAIGAELLAPFVFVDLGFSTFLQ
jgi:hypothetical protein